MSVLILKDFWRIILKDVWDLILEPKICPESQDAVNYISIAHKPSCQASKSLVE